MMPLRQDKAVLVATNGVFFAYLNLVKLPPNAMPGQLNSSNLVTSLLRTLLVPVGVRLGMCLSGRFTNDRCFGIGQTCIFFTSGKLLYDGLRNLHLI